MATLELGAFVVNLEHSSAEPTIPERSVFVERLPDSYGVFHEYIQDEGLQRLLIDAVVDSVVEVALLEQWRHDKENGIVFTDQEGQTHSGYRLRLDYPVNASVIREGYPNRRVTFQLERYE